MQATEIQRTDLKRYIPYVAATTALLVAIPVALAYRFSGAPYDFPLLATTAICTAMSIVLGRLGALLWQMHPGSRDVVFDDLLLWGFVRRLRNERRVIHHADRLVKGLSKRAQLSVLMKLAKALESGDPYTHGHSDRVARHAFMIARAMKLPRRERERIRLAGALHDIGKLRTPREILTKPDRLTDEEFAIVKRHPGDGAAIVAALNDDRLTAIVRHHHERLDGAGYPDRVSGENIPLGARIIAVADTFDAITSRRAYRAPRRHKDAIDIITKEAGTQLDANVVRAFITYYTGRRGIRLWLSVSSAIPRVFDAAAGTVQRVATSAAVVGTTAIAAIGGGAFVRGTAVENHYSPVAAGVTSGENFAPYKEAVRSARSSASGDTDSAKRRLEVEGRDPDQRARNGGSRRGDSGSGARDEGSSADGTATGNDNGFVAVPDSGSSDPGTDTSAPIAIEDGSNSGPGSDSSGSDGGTNTDNSGTGGGGTSGGDSGSGDGGSGSGDSGSGDGGSGSSDGGSSDGGSSGGDSGSGDSGSGGGSGSGDSGDGGDGDGLLDIVDDILGDV